LVSRKGRQRDHFEDLEQYENPIKNIPVGTESNMKRVSHVRLSWLHSEPALPEQDEQWI